MFVLFQAELIVKLEQALEEIDGELKKRDMKERRKKRSTKWAYTDLCMDNILPDVSCVHCQLCLSK